MQGQETKYFHAFVAEWLTQHGYTYEHEVTLSQNGRVDFVAKASDDTILLVECKLELRTLTTIKRAIFQVRDYCEQYSDQAKAVLAAPYQAISDDARKLCAKCNILLIEIDRDREIEFQITYDKFSRKLYNRFVPFTLASNFKLADNQIDFAWIFARQGIIEYACDTFEFLTSQGWGHVEAWEKIRANVFEVAQRYIAPSMLDKVINQGFALESQKRFMLLFKNVVGEMNPVIYTEIREKMYVGIWERTSSQLHDELNLTAKQNIRDHFGELASFYTRLAEEISGDRLSRMESLPLNKAMEIIWEVAKMISQQAKATSEMLGMDLVTEKPLLRG
ncbi:MAG: restriction endonuclease [Chloroflexota bacterium]